MRVFGQRGSRSTGGGGDAAAGTPAVAGSIVKQARSKSGAGCVAGFFSLFAVFGLLFAVPFFGFAAVKILKARSWPAVPCTILESRVATHAGDDGDTYAVEVRYRYEIAGRTYEGTRYKFLGGASSGASGKQAIVDELTPGTHVACYVDPADPTSAVIHRGFTADFLFALIPLLFVAVGVGGAALSLRSLRKSRQAAGDRPASVSLPGGVPLTLGSFVPQRGATLKPSGGPLGRFLGVLLIAAFWDGITGVFAYHVVADWQRGGGDGCATAFLVPFVLVGLLLLAAVPYQFLALFNPRPQVHLDQPSLALGGGSRVSWQFSGWPSRIGRLRITLEGREEATYRRGTTTTTDKSVFYRLALLDTTDSPTIARGAAFVSLPADLAGSFAAGHNKIVWVMKLHGEIRFWPDVTEEIPLTVTPPEALP